MSVFEESSDTAPQSLNLRDLSPGESVPVPATDITRERIVRNWGGEHQSPLVSVICHCYNHERFIESALNGILMQETDFPFEVIVHDDASTDATREIIQSYQGRFAGIVKPLFQDENQYSRGVRPLKFSLPMAKGEFVALCEGDDYWLSPDKLQAQVNALRENSKHVMCFHNAIRISENGEFISMMNPCSKSVIEQDDLARSPFVPTLTRMFRNYGYPWIESPNTPVANDICLTAYLSQFGGAIYLYDNVLSVYRHHEHGVWSKKSEYEKARITVDARLFIAGHMNEDASGRQRYSHMEISIHQLFDLLSPAQSLKVVSSYFLKKIFFTVGAMCRKWIGKGG